MNFIALEAGKKKLLQLHPNIFISLTIMQKNLPPKSPHSFAATTDTVGPSFTTTQEQDPEGIISPQRMRPNTENAQNTPLPKQGIQRKRFVRRSMVIIFLALLLVMAMVSLIPW